MQARRVVVSLPPDAYRRLERVAREEVRATDQQASYILRRFLTETLPHPPGPADER